MNNFCVKRKYQKRRIVKNENLIHGYLQKVFLALKVSRRIKWITSLDIGNV